MKAVPDDAFLDLPGRIYRDDPHWLGEDRAAVLKQFDDARAAADLKVWAKAWPGKARLAAFFSPKQMVDDLPTAFFGFWETEEYFPANEELFREAEDWAQQQGARQILGPINFSTFNPYRVRLNHFDKGCFPGEPWNPPWYPDLMEKLGYAQRKRFHSWIGSLEGRSETMAAMVEPVYQQLTAEGVSFSNLTGDQWLENLDTFYRYVDQIFNNNYAYTGISEAAFRAGFGEPLARKLSPTGSVLARDSDGEIAGFFIAIPDYAPLACQGNPRRVPLARLSYEDVSKITAPTLLGKTGGVHPRFRNKGLFSVMSYLMVCQGARHYPRGGAVLVREDNPSARVGSAAFGRPDDQRRDYALYARSL